MNKNKFLYFTKSIIVISFIAFASSFSTSLFNQKTDYTPGNSRAMDDTGYTVHSSGWPVNFYRYTSYMNIGTPVVTDGEIDLPNFAVNTLVFYIPAVFVFIGLMKPFNYSRNKLKQKYRGIRNRRSKTRRIA